jgi:hypothetical protein
VRNAFGRELGLEAVFSRDDVVRRFTGSGKNLIEIYRALVNTPAFLKRRKGDAQ